MNRYLRAVGMALLASWMGCADFSEAEQAFCVRNPQRCGEALQARVLLPSVSVGLPRFGGHRGYAANLSGSAARS